MGKTNIEQRIATNKVVIGLKKEIAKIERKIKKEDDIIIKTLKKLKSILCNVKIEKEIKNTNIQLIELCEKITESKKARVKLIDEIKLSKDFLVKWEKAIKELIGE